MLTCRECGREYPDRATVDVGRWRCVCGHALDFAERSRSGGAPPETLDRDRGLWAFESLLPVTERVTLGEGWTPLVDAPGWDCQFKLESLFPTGSFKDRGATATLSWAVELGVDRVVEDSSGNAGLAVATYAARAGIDAEIYVPADAAPGKLRAIERTGADLVRVEGSREDVTEACIDAVSGGDATDRPDADPDSGNRTGADHDDGDRAGGGTDGTGGADAWYASHAWNPAFFAGTSTFAFELAAQRDWTVPDAVVTPLGHGTLLLGAYRGFRRLRDAGWTDAVPRLLGAQATGAAPVADALGGSDDGPANTVADGIQIREPARRDQVVDAVTDTGGDAVAVGPAPTEREHDRLAEAGFYVEPTCATATAALDRFRERGALEPGDDVVVALTGTGLK
jgi:threonine synthase